ncbi:MAG TPA: hypothetical protein VNI84_16995 [Pyrinomonadaceae bacterium]|nr:hypothetical protein [Pyrinomonadaceae bacterium]
MGSRISGNYRIIFQTDYFTRKLELAEIDFRCHIGNVESPFEPEAVEAIYTNSKGIPREAIKLCAMSVQYAILNELTTIPREIVDMAQNDMAQPKELIDEKPIATMKATRKIKDVRRSKV